MWFPRLTVTGTVITRKNSEEKEGQNVTSVVSDTPMGPSRKAKSSRDELGSGPRGRRGGTLGMSRPRGRGTEPGREGPACGSCICVSVCGSLCAGLLWGMASRGGGKGGPGLG